MPDSTEVQVERLRQDLAAEIDRYKAQLSTAQLDVLLKFAARNVTLEEVPASATLFLEAHHLLTRNRDDPAGWLLFDIAAKWGGGAANLYRLYRE